MHQGVRCCEFQGCKRPVHIESRTGREHDYCGRTHATAAQAKQGKALRAPHGDCHICALPGCSRPIFFDPEIGRVHDFCGITHAQEAERQGLWPTSNRKRQGQGDENNRCALPGCSAPRFVEIETGYMHDFCGRTHARQAQAKGMLGAKEACVDEGNQVDRVWAGRDGEPEYVISMLTKKHPRYQGIKAQFHDTWLHPGPKPTVMRIYQVRNPEHVFSTFSRYKDLLMQGAEKMGERVRHREAINEVRRWHGTSMSNKCSFGININQPPCSDRNCAVCTICATSFDITQSGRAPFGGSQRRRLRYGRGLYFSKVSSKANDYADTTERQFPHGTFRAMFLCKVALGRSLRVMEEEVEEAVINENLEARSQGGSMHSVQGVTCAEGGGLNYEETVVYRNDAAIPSYLIVYKMN